MRDPANGGRYLLHQMSAIRGWRWQTYNSSSHQDVREHGVPAASGEADSQGCGDAFNAGEPEDRREELRQTQGSRMDAGR